MQAQQGDAQRAKRMGTRARASLSCEDKGCLLPDRIFFHENCKAERQKGRR